MKLYLKCYEKVRILSDRNGKRVAGCERRGDPLVILMDAHGAAPEGKSDLRKDDRENGYVVARARVGGWEADGRAARVPRI